jgi:hypothetical protein
VGGQSTKNSPASRNETGLSITAKLLLLWHQHSVHDVHNPICGLFVCLIWLRHVYEQRTSKGFQLSEVGERSTKNSPASRNETGLSTN